MIYLLTTYLSPKCVLSCCKFPLILHDKNKTCSNSNAIIQNASYLSVLRGLERYHCKPVVNMYLQVEFTRVFCFSYLFRALFQIGLDWVNDYRSLRGLCAHRSFALISILFCTLEYCAILNVFISFFSRFTINGSRLATWNLKPVHPQLFCVRFALKDLTGRRRT